MYLLNYPDKKYPKPIIWQYFQIIYSTQFKTQVDHYVDDH